MNSFLFNEDFYSPQGNIRNVLWAITLEVNGKEICSIFVIYGKAVNFLFRLVILAQVWCYMRITDFPLPSTGF